MFVVRCLITCFVLLFVFCLLVGGCLLFYFFDAFVYVVCSELLLVFCVGGWFVYRLVFGIVNFGLLLWCCLDCWLFVIVFECLVFNSVVRWFVCCGWVLALVNFGLCVL